MDKHLEISGICTNNLKSIDIKIPHNKVIAITGISGGGKTSLAYETIHALCSQEFKTIETGYFEDANYDVQSYSGLIPSIAIKQKNSNINPRSTLYSYLNVSSILAAAIRQKETNLSPDLLKLNSPNNECPRCYGLGEVNTISQEKIINYDVSIFNNPFLPWSAPNTDKYEKLLHAYCESSKIDVKKTFGQLSKKTQRDLLWGESDQTFNISFKYNGKRRSRGMKYIGVMRELEMYANSGKVSFKNIADKYSDSIQCPECLGSRINKIKFNNFKICNISFSDFLSLTITDIVKKISSQKKTPIQQLIQLLKTIETMGLGYLTFSRSIPSLSGGELQKLNFSKLTNTNISNIAAVVDEISSQLHISDYLSVKNGIKKVVGNGNTIVLVEHNQYFVDLADLVITLGPKAGHEGGYIIQNNKLKHWFQPTHSSKISNEFITYSNVNINNIQNLKVRFPRSSLTALVGKSGSGKSSLAEYLSKNFKEVNYVSQSLIRGNIRSNVATILGLNQVIAKYYSVGTKQNIEKFTLAAGYIGACQACNGTGVVRYERTYEKSIEIKCDCCDGRLFSTEANKYVFNGLTIAELFSRTFEQLKSGPIVSDVYEKYVDAACELGLGHLSLNRKTQSLSGGELRRLKLMGSLVTNARVKNVLIVDEPGSGLDDLSASRVVKYIKSKINNFQAIVVIDHKPSVFLEADFLIEMGPDSGCGGGKITYQGNPLQYYESNYLPYLKR